MGGLRFRVAIEGDEFQMTISVALVPSTTRGADAKGCSEAAFSAAYDSCLSYMEEHGDELASRGFDASELRKQQAAADMWLLARNQ